MDLKTQLKEFEGFRRQVYKDTRGFWTIGYGRLVDNRFASAGITQDEAEVLLDNDIAKVRTAIFAVHPWIAGLDHPRQAVLIGMAFQMGVKGLLEFRQTLAATRDSRFPTAAALMLESNWAKQTPNRAKRLARQMETGEWQ